MRQFIGTKTERIEDLGWSDVTTDVNGNATWSHNLGVVPDGVLVTPRLLSAMIVPTIYAPGTTASVIHAVFFTGSGTRYANQAFRVSWLAWVDA